MESAKPSAAVRVEVVGLDQHGGRQIAVRDRLTEVLRDRAAEIEAAIAETTRIAQAALASADDGPSWKVSTMEASFGLTLTAETGVIVGKASAGACLEITLTLERR